MAGDTQQLLQQSLLGEAVDFLEDVAVFVWNEERHYVAVNDAACKLTGLSREELVGMAVGDMSPDRATADMQRVQSASVTDGASSFTRRDGTVIELEWTTVHTRIAGLPYMVSICRRREAR